jgi:phytoene dehydrogenase-like protein
MMTAMPQPEQDVVIVGGGHNALVAATLLARAGFSVRVLERRTSWGGAAVSGRPFDVDARLSRYSYLVSLFPRGLLADLGVEVELRRRTVGSCTPDAERALVVSDDAEATRRSFDEVTGDPTEYDRWLAWQQVTLRAAEAVAPTLLAPLQSADSMRERMGDEAWALLTQPIGPRLQETFTSDLVRGVVLTDALIGTFARSDETSLRQNRCFLYHVIGNGTGDWDVPVGGMGALTAQLEAAARAAGAVLEAGVEVTSLETDEDGVLVRTADGSTHAAAAAICTAAPAVLDRLLGRGPRATWPGSQVKVNMVLSRLPRLRSGVEPAVAFAGTLHINERMSQLDAAFDAAPDGLPEPLPCEVYCHTLTDPSILSPELAEAGVHTLTLFALHTPAGAFEADPQGSARAALDAALRSLQSVLAEPLEDCLLRTADGSPCLEIHTPHDLQADLAMPGGNIFHGDLAWPWAESEAEVGSWGVETDLPRVFLGGSGARRGGAVSGIGGHNAAMAVQQLLGAATGGQPVVGAEFV